jgi:aldehyde:ferredoxin oxidoreductase
MPENRAYAGEILRVDLASGETSRIPTADYSSRFLGGRGMAAALYWKEVPPETGALELSNKLMFFTGPLAGFNGLGSSRWTVCGKSPLTRPQQFSSANLGGDWGVQLKFAGYDGLIVEGASDRPVYLHIDDGAARLRDASALWGKTTVETRDLLKQELGDSTRVAACGPAGENGVAFATILADADASGSCGFGAVMGSKKLKAVAVRGSRRPLAADPERLADLTRRVRELKRDAVGLGQQDLIVGGRTRRDICHGCIGACIRQTFRAEDGTSGKYSCGSAWFYQERAMRYYGAWNEVPFFATRLCDAWGLDTDSMTTLMMWLSRCHKAGILDDAHAGLPISRMGSYEFIEAMVKSIASREGFGDTMAQGVLDAATTLGRAAEDLVTDYTSKAGYSAPYCPRMFPAHSLLYATEPRLPIHQLHEIGVPLFEWIHWAGKGEGSYLSSEVFRKIARRFWGSELAVDFSTFEGKALAAARIQDREYAKESLILCDWMWPITHVRLSEDHIGDPTLESSLLSAATGLEVTEDELYRIGERLFNLGRAIRAREGHLGRSSDVLPVPFHTRPLKAAVQNPECLAPGARGEAISLQGSTVDEDKFEVLKDEYYSIRGWDVASGLQTREKLMQLGLEDVAQDLHRRGTGLA